MPPEALPAGWNWRRRAEPAELIEWMDQPCTFEELRACLHDIGEVNRWTRGYTPTLHFLEQLVARSSRSEKLRILDVGFGGGDALHRIARWAKRRDLRVELTGIELNPAAVLVAKEQFGAEDIRWLSGDVFLFDEEIDVVISSLLTHHLETSTVLRLLRWMEQTAKCGWFVNDLERSTRSAKLFALLSRVMRWHRFVQHDGPVSFARSFVHQDWEGMLRSSGISPDAAELQRSFPGRLCVSRFK